MRYLILEAAFIKKGGVMDGLELEVGLLHLFALMPHPAVLEPDGDLLGV